MTPSVFIGIPTGRNGWLPEFTMSLIDVLGHQMGEALGCASEPVVKWGYYRSSALPQNRHNLVRMAQKADASHILFLDDDMTFPPNTLERLLAANKPIVSTNCTTRTVPVITTAIKDDKRIMSEGRSGLEEVDQVGMAVMLINLKVFDRIPLPWFKFDWDEEYPETYCSEDIYFCRKANQAGFRVWIDHDLSLGIGHLGEMEYGHDLVTAEEIDKKNAQAGPFKHIKVA